ncbi:MAG: hypothetical protein U0531_07645 [Dehalococcoidia bacterium]
MPDVVTGRVWKFGDNINTDLMVPGFTLRFSAKDQLKYLFSANRTRRKSSPATWSASRWTGPLTST